MFYEVPEVYFYCFKIREPYYIVCIHSHSVRTYHRFVMSVNRKPHGKYVIQIHLMTYKIDDNRKIRKHDLQWAYIIYIYIICGIRIEIELIFSRH